MRHFGLAAKLAAVIFAFLPRAWAAPVTLVSDPGALSAPTASELAAATAFIGSIPDIPPDSIVTGLRNPPATLVNTGLDAAAPPLAQENQNNEVGVLPLPQITDSCPGSTPVTITLSQWSVEQTARTFAGTQRFGLGLTVIDSRNPSLFEPVSTALVTSPENVELPGPQPAPSASYIATFADLPFYTVGTGIEVSKVVEVAAVLQVAQSSYEIDPPSITLEYDDANCTSVSSNAAPVPLLGPLQLALLLILVTAAGLVALRRVTVERR